MSAHPQGGGHVATLPGGRELFYRERPGGGPTVVFEAGMGATRTSWGLVQPAVGRRVRAVAYDRAGLGASPAVAGPRGVAELAADLGALLDHLGDGPFVLVGHSWGGPVTRLATAARPDRVRALVLVDPSDERCDAYFSADYERLLRTQRRMLPPMARLGLARLAFAPVVRTLPPLLRAEARADYYTPANTAAFLAEAEHMIEDLRSLLAEPPDTGDVPVTVISGARSGGIGRRNREALIAAHATRGRQVLARRSGHLVMLSEPELVVSEVSAWL